MEHLIQLIAAIVTIFCAICLVVDTHQNCNFVQMMVVKKQWSKAYATSKGGENRVAIGLRIWTEIFEQVPEVKSKYFRRVNAANLTSHQFTDFSRNVLSGFDIAISLLGDTETLQAQLNHLKLHHDFEDPIPEICFDVFLNTLMKIVEETVGDAFDKAAWENCGRLLMEAIQ